jgi:hypothetical protein
MCSKPRSVKGDPSKRSARVCRPMAPFRVVVVVDHEGVRAWSASLGGGEELALEQLRLEHAL